MYLTVSVWRVLNLENPSSTHVEIRTKGERTDQSLQSGRRMSQIFRSLSKCSAELQSQRFWTYSDSRKTRSNGRAIKDLLTFFVKIIDSIRISLARSDCWRRCTCPSSEARPKNNSFYVDERKMECHRCASLQKHSRSWSFESTTLRKKSHQKRKNVKWHNITASFISYFRGIIDPDITLQFCTLSIQQFTNAWRC